jgi:hypothetical protein
MLEPISRIRSGFRARRGAVRRRQGFPLRPFGLWRTGRRDKRKSAAYTVVCEHFKPVGNAAMGP